MQNVVPELENIYCCIKQHTSFLYSHLQHRSKDQKYMETFLKSTKLTVYVDYRTGRTKSSVLIIVGENSLDQSVLSSCHSMPRVHCISGVLSAGNCVLEFKS